MSSRYDDAIVAAAVERIELARRVSKSCNADSLNEEISLSEAAAAIHQVMVEPASRVGAHLPSKWTLDQQARNSVLATNYARSGLVCPAAAPKRTKKGILAKNQGPGCEDPKCIRCKFVADLTGGSK